MLWRRDLLCESKRSFHVRDESHEVSLDFLSWISHMRKISLVDEFERIATGCVLKLAGMTPSYSWKVWLEHWGIVSLHVLNAPSGGAAPEAEEDITWWGARLRIPQKEEGRRQQKEDWFVDYDAHNGREARLVGWAEVSHVAAQLQVHTSQQGPETQEMSLDKTAEKFPINNTLPEDVVLDSYVAEDYQPSLESSWCY